MIKSQDPLVSKKDLSPFLDCKDYTVSRETFSLVKDNTTGLLVTSPRPSLENLSSYYESEDYISHTDSSRSLMDKVYQMIKGYSIKKKLKMINKLAVTKGHLLDIGCGTGDLLAACENDGWKIDGVEPSEKARALASEKIATTECLEESLEAILEKKQNKYDVITMFHVLEHVPNLTQYVDSLHQLLTEDGCLIVAVPNYKSYDADHYKQFWAAYDVPRHLWHFSQESIQHIFGAKGFHVAETLPLIFDSFYVSMLSEKYKTGTSNLIKAFKTGLRSNIKAKRSGQYSSLIYIIKKSK
ncbi:class I SAM-dependent methyltransferase [Lutimonas sp.]|uniref:class I SAM-dependent methyltransferase n=1 Tax=Lutimonas sp. TaxID=1872403 RepID=UPI003D9ABD5E